MKPPKAKDIQIRTTPAGKHSINCRHGKELTQHGIAHALLLWAVSWGKAQP